MSDSRINKCCKLLSELEGELFELEREYSAQRDRLFLASDPGPVSDSSYVAGLLAGARFYLGNRAGSMAILELKP